MKRLGPIALGMMLLAGCIGPGGRDQTVRGRELFEAMQAAVTKASESAEPAVVLFELEGIQKSDGRSVIVVGGQASTARNRREKSINGVVLTTNGYALVADTIKPDDVDRITAWVGDTDYRARVVKSDDQLDLTIVKIDADQPLVPLDIEVTGDLQMGAWCVGVQPSDEVYDYQPFASLAYCRGWVDGRYREFLLDHASGLKEGTPLLDLDGRVAGIVHQRGRVLAMRDLREDLLVLLDDASGVKSADQEAKRNTWFGALLKPINKDYARKHELPESAIWVQHVMTDASADRAGVRAGDLLVGVNGLDIRFSGQRARQFFVKTLRPRVDDPFDVTVLRAGERLICSGVFIKKPEEETLRADDLGITVRKIDPGAAVARNLFTDKGVLINDIRKGSAAAVGSNMRSSLLNKGDIITALAGEPTPDLEAFSAVLEKLRRDPPDVVLVSYMRGRTTGFAALNLQLGERDVVTE